MIDFILFNFYNLATLDLENVNILQNRTNILLLILFNCHLKTQ